MANASRRETGGGGWTGRGDEPGVNPHRPVHPPLSSDRGCELAGGGGEWIALQNRNATVAGNRHSKKSFRLNEKNIFISFPRNNNEENINYF